jgi:3-oxoacyl-[acyl-carrier protein] reductase
MDATPLKGRVALVTGAGRNIARAIALALADAGAKVAVNVRANVDEGERAVDDIVARGGDAFLVRADVTQRTDVDAMIAAIAQRCERLDILVNNAAVRREAAFSDLSYADWRMAQAVCVDGTFHCTQAALSLLRASEAAAVINIGGMTAHTGALRRAHVVTAKAALGGLTRALARAGAVRHHRELRLARHDRHGAQR